ncbi:MAG: PQQ-like beta-propeller repeat protein [Gemmataceae bacterium]|nr:PQQ-like beta-propeller repeat protein [Gemmataceae bacterium]
MKLLILLALCAPAPEPGAAEWPMFRGPKRDGLSPDKGLLKAWPKDGPKLLWKATGAGIGLSSVTVAGGKVFTMGTRDGKTFIHAFDAAKGGEPLWSAEIGKGGRENYDGTRCTPTYSDGMVYGVSAYGDFAAVSADKGEAKWAKDYKKDYGGSHGSWQFAESPLVDGDRVILTPGGRDATLVCLEKKTGKEVWKSAAGGQAGYSSVVISNAGGVKQYVTLLASGTVGVDAESGKLLWKYSDYAGNVANIPTQIPMGDQVLTVAGYRGRRGKAALLALSKDGDKFTTKEVWSEDKLLNKHGGVIVVGDRMFGDTDDGGRPYAANVKTGETIWTRGREGTGGGSAAITYADGMLYVRYANGTMSLVPADGDKYVEKGSFKVPAAGKRRGSSNWSHPVVIGGRMYLRNDDAIYCHDVKAK